MRAIPIISIVCFLMSGCPSDSKKECTSDGDCPAGRYCQGDKCAFDCTFNEDCPPDYRCTERGRCERGCVETNNGIEACDLIDNDCDELTDEDFTDLGLACDFGCAAGVYVCSSDGSQSECNAPHPAADDSECNGLDDDCDELTDEDALDRPCPLQQGVCAGAHEVCQGAAGYSACDYGADYTAGVDATCDKLDEDCDGETDEDAEQVLAPEDGVQASDGLDNNCNGLIDELGGVLVPSIHFENLWIDAYETTVFENPDCSGIRYGEGTDNYPAQFPASGTPTVELYACSLPGLIPSGHLSWHRAKWACEAQGKRLCSIDEWQIACSDGNGTNYPYGMLFVAGACNDAWGGAGHAVETGSYPNCHANNRLWDTSGNLAEWLNSFNLNAPDQALLGGWAYECVLHGSGGNLDPCDPEDIDDEEDIEEMSGCKINDDAYLFSLPPEAVLPFVGVRCCLDGP